ncbi:hypothetical protein PP175_26395 (plasmid) [Aneurinibacillus sp. Ricciae_BoGa-3]|nr:hypothetical protein [Aneurinibacillus sp. Ricciae_BoGa-3]WCK57598.1 hypothetical protein PP175_26395 [Aneurinibacillus sp. Ricciae_BoGa-3]
MNYCRVCGRVVISINGYEEDICYDCLNRGFDSDDSDGLAEDDE